MKPILSYPIFTNPWRKLAIYPCSLNFSSLSNSVAANNLTVSMNKLALGSQETIRDPHASRLKQTALGMVLLCFSLLLNIWNPSELRKADSPLSREMISFRLQEIEYKKNVEKNMKDAYSRLNSVYLRDPNVGDNWNQVRADYVDSSSKHRIYSQALRQYEGVNIGAFDDEEEEEGTHDFFQPHFPTSH